MSRIHAHESYIGHLLCCVVEEEAKQDYSCCASMAEEIVEVAEEVFSCRDIEEGLNKEKVAAWATIREMKGKNPCMIVSAYVMLQSLFGLDF